MDDLHAVDDGIEFLVSHPDAPESWFDTRFGRGWRRPVAFLLVLGSCLGAVGVAAADTYRRDQSADRAAAALVLREKTVGDPVSLPDAASLGAAGSWSAEPSTAAEVDLVNLGPDAITLLPADLLRGPGVIAGSLDPSGSGRLNPGQVGRLAGTVRVDCHQTPATSSPAAAQTTLLVRAVRANGSVGTMPIGLDTAGESVRDQICLQQGAAVISGDFPLSVDPTRHTFTIALSARSLANAPLRYALTLSYPGATAPYPGAVLGEPKPVAEVSGELAPGAILSGGYVVPVTRCPTALPEENADVDLQLTLPDAAGPVLLRADSFDLSILVEAACGRIR